MPQIDNNEVPVNSGSDEIKYCECVEPELKSQKTVVIDGTEFIIPLSGAFLMICHRCKHQTEGNKGGNNNG